MCSDYLTLSIHQRKRKIIQLNFCFNYFGDHTVNRCSNTYRCKKCGQKHHTTIHESFNSPKTVVFSKDNKLASIDSNPLTSAATQ